MIFRFASIVRAVGADALAPEIILNGDFVERQRCRVLRMSGGSHVRNGKSKQPSEEGKTPRVLTPRVARGVVSL